MKLEAQALNRSTQQTKENKQGKGKTSGKSKFSLKIDKIIDYRELVEIQDKEHGSWGDSILKFIDAKNLKDLIDRNKEV